MLKNIQQGNINNGSRASSSIPQDKQDLLPMLQNSFTLSQVETSIGMEHSFIFTLQRERV